MGGIIKKRVIFMPLVTINSLELSEYQKKNIAKKITEAVSIETNVPKDKVYVMFSGYPLDSIAAGGVLNSELSPEIIKMFNIKESEKLRNESSQHIIRRFRAKKGLETDAFNELKKLAYQARAAKGCSGFDIYRSCIELANGKLENSVFIIREAWDDISSLNAFEAGHDYENFKNNESNLFEGDHEIVKKLNSSSQNFIDINPEKIYAVVMIKSSEKNREKIKTSLNDILQAFREKEGCMSCELYQGMYGNGQGVLGSGNPDTFYIEQVWKDSEALNNSSLSSFKYILDSKGFTDEELEICVFNMLTTPVEHLTQNAVLGDPELMAGLVKLNPEFGELCINASGVPWGKPLLDQKLKTFIAIVVDVVEQITGKPFENHLLMAKKQGITREELEELFLLLTIYTGFNKAGVFYAELLRIYGPK